MPAARVDVAIAANKGGSDLGGVGSLEPADKSAVYSRNTTGTATAHNYYAPFYDTYIPSTSRGPLSSGIDGPAQGNNFRGFLVDGLYNYWSFAEVLRTAVPVNTTCLRRKDEAPVYRQTPSGPQVVAVYTDEHGEAQVEYNPGTGAYYDALGDPERQRRMRPRGRGCSSARRASPPRRGTRTRRSAIRRRCRLRWARKCIRCSPRTWPSTRRVPGEANANVADRGGAGNRR